MTAARLPLPVPDLGPQRVAIRIGRVLHAAAVDVVGGYIEGFNGDLFLRVIDIPNGEAIFVPLPAAMARKTAADLLNAANAKQHH